MCGTLSRVCSGAMPGDVAPALSFHMLTALPSRAWHTHDRAPFDLHGVCAGRARGHVGISFFCSRSERPDVYRCTGGRSGRNWRSTGRFYDAEDAHHRGMHCASPPRRGMSRQILNYPGRFVEGMRSSRERENLPTELGSDSPPRCVLPPLTGVGWNSVVG